MKLTTYMKRLFILAIATAAFACNGGTKIGTDDIDTTGTIPSAALCNKVFEYTPAPGQFINEGFTCTTAEEAADWAMDRLLSGNFVSLGGFGGYIVVGFNHSIPNSGGYDIRIKSNYFPGSSKPGIVWVMRDENNNGLPDDTWYELKGSEFGKSSTIENYSVTYYREANPGGAVAWSDNQGGSGTIEHNSYHTQDYYYPLWAPAGSYTLTGTRLAPNAEQTTPNYWEMLPCDWGYADNVSSIDDLGLTGSLNHFRISDAVDAGGHPVNLPSIDFVKVQTGINATAGQLGEVATVVCAIYDYNLIK